MKRILGYLLTFGFVVGIVYVNFLGEVGDNSLFTTESFANFLETKFKEFSYFFYIIKNRIPLLIVFLVLAFVKCKKLFVYIFVLWVGFLFGAFLVNGIIAQGLCGLLLCFGMMFPHMLFYIMAAWQVMMMQWDVKKGIIMGSFFLLGVLAETFVNPGVVKGLIMLMKLNV